MDTASMSQACRARGRCDCLGLVRRELSGRVLIAAALTLALSGCMSGDGSSTVAPPAVVPPVPPAPPVVGHYRATRLELLSLFTDVDPYKVHSVMGSAINSAGSIAGLHGPSYTSQALLGILGNPGPFTPFIFSSDLTADLCAPACKAGQGQAINNAGQITGMADGHAFLYSGGKMVEIGAPGGLWSSGYGINDSGQIVGAYVKTASSSSANEITRAFIFSAGNMVDMGTLGGSNSWAYGVNSMGDATGWADTPGDNVSARRAFIYSDNKMIDLGLPPGSGQGSAINDSGEVAGTFNPPGFPVVSHAFLRTGGQTIDINELFPAGINSRSNAINNRGQVVGRKIFPDYRAVAFLYSGGQVFDLNDLITEGRDELDGWTVQDATAINDSGQIVAIACWYTNACKTWRLDPIP